MRFLSERLIFALTIGSATLFAGVSQFSAVVPAAAQEGITQPERPFQLPFAQPPGPDTWLMAQPYGNTTGAYRQRFTTYGASGGIHFGLDLSTPCGTEIVAIADGTVFAVDGPFGSPPHNLMIDHPQLGYASMYGHLLEAPGLAPGQAVKQGEVIALSGDSSEQCYLRAHLHLEIRDLNHVRKYNPALLIDANWDNLALVGNSGRDFARDLEEPRKWQSLYDQPEAQTGGPILNDFPNAWPLDWEKRSSTGASLASLTLPGSSQSPSPEPASLRVSAVGRQITGGNCCTQPYWSADSSQVRFIDRPEPDAPAGIWGVDVTQAGAAPQVVARLGLYSPDGALMVYPDRNKGVAVVERLADSQTWEIDTQERALSFTPDSQRLFWLTYDEDAPRDTRSVTFWLANIDGSNARAFLQASRTDPVAWLPGDKLLMSRRFGGSSDEQLFTLSLTDGSQTDLWQIPRMRGLALSPDRRYLVYYTNREAETAKNGLWLLDLQNPTQAPRNLPFFGAYRWRDSERLIYVPFDPDAAEHNFYQYNVATGQTLALFPGGTNLMITNNDWQVSPDGRQIALVAVDGAELDGVWLLELDAELKTNKSKLERGNQK